MKTIMLSPSVLLTFFVWSWIACQAPVNSDSKLVPVGPLPKELTENSGLIEMDDDLYVGLNDGGDQPNLYLFSLKRRSGTRIVKINNAQNVDWEDLTMDNDYIYIGDTGNNSGDRKDLVIYRVKKDDLRAKKQMQTQKRSHLHIILKPNLARPPKTTLTAKP